MTQTWQWYSPLEAPFRLVGLEDGENYLRIPKEQLHLFRPEVQNLAHHTSGGQIHFQTTSPKIAVQVQLRGPAYMHHMAATAQSGVDLYVGEPQHLLFVGTAGFNYHDTSYESELASFSHAEPRNCVLNLPLYQGIKEIKIGLLPDVDLTSPPPFQSNKRIVVYGTSITQGACASRPGMSYSNILSRRLNLPFLNLGFSGNGKGDPEVAEFIAGLSDLACVILDYEANCVDTATYEKTLPVFIETLRARHARLPILLISRTRSKSQLLDPGFARELALRLAFQERLIEDLRQAGDANVHFLNGQNLFQNQDGADFTVDGVHLTDLGFYHLANAIEKELLPVVE